MSGSQFSTGMGGIEWTGAEQEQCGLLAAEMQGMGSGNALPHTNNVEYAEQTWGPARLHPRHPAREIQTDIRTPEERVRQQQAACRPRRKTKHQQQLEHIRAHAAAPTDIPARAAAADTPAGDGTGAPAQDGASAEHAFKGLLAACKEAGSAPWLGRTSSRDAERRGANGGKAPHPLATAGRQPRSLWCWLTRRTQQPAGMRPSPGGPANRNGK
jgi:hypothetical protein